MSDSYPDYTLHNFTGSDLNVMLQYKESSSDSDFSTAGTMSLPSGSSSGVSLSELPEGSAFQVVAKSAAGTDSSKNDKDKLIFDQTFVLATSDSNIASTKIADLVLCVSNTVGGTNVSKTPVYQSLIDTSGSADIVDLGGSSALYFGSVKDAAGNVKRVTSARYRVGQLIKSNMKSAADAGADTTYTAQSIRFYTPSLTQKFVKDGLKGMYTLRQKLQEGAKKIMDGSLDACDVPFIQNIPGACSGYSPTLFWLMTSLVVLFFVIIVVLLVMIMKLKKSSPEPSSGDDNITNMGYSQNPY